MPGTLYVDVVSPAGSVFRGEAQGVRAPGVGGSFEVLHNHAPMIAAFEVGPFYITLPSGERLAYATSGGFLEVLNNTVTVLAETAEPATDIDVERARAAEERALERMQGAADSEERQRAAQDLERARNRLRIAMGQVGASRTAS
jgi:F-type H+-transporting ATPase subunit epsilon